MAATSVLLYLAKANAALLLFAAAYFGLLRRLTFFTLNRFYLLFALLFAAGYPAVPVPALLPAEATSAVVFAVAATTGMPGPTAAAAAVPAVDWAAVGVALYAAGVAVLLLRLLGQLLALARLRRTARPAVVQGQAVRVLAGAASPFSFGSSIYLNPDQHPAPELAAVLRHERVHVRQGHTLDVLLAQLAQAAAWCNPAAWLLARALRDNLEYLADQAVLQTGLDRRAYQYSLLRLSHGMGVSPLVSHFTFPTLKNRVVMMNTPLSSSGQLARYFVAGPLVLAVALSISGARAQGAGPVPARPTPLPNTYQSVAENTLAEPGQPGPVYFVDGQQRPGGIGDIKAEDIASMTLLTKSRAHLLLGGATVGGAALVTTKANEHRADVVAFNKKVNAANADGISDLQISTQVRRTRVADTTAHQLPAGIKAYIARTYPQGRLSGWFIVEQSSPKAPEMKYTAMVKDGDQTHRLAFNAAEQLVPLPERATLAASAGPPTYYVDGQLYTQDINTLAPEDIASINVVKGAEASQAVRQRLGDNARNGVLFITTKANQNRADVVAFNQQMSNATAPAAVAAPAPPAPGTAYLAAPALAYIATHYPDARLLEVTEMKATDGGPSRYQALIATGRRPTALLFDGQGGFVSEVPAGR